MTARTDDGATTETDDEVVVETVDDPAAVLEDSRKKGRENASLKAKMREANAELKRLKAFEDAAKTDGEKALDVARTETRAEVEAEFKEQILAERILARAATKLADPSDSALLDSADLDPNDPDGIDKALDALVKSKPHLGIVGDGKPGDIDQGPRGRVAGAKTKPTGEDWIRGELKAKGL